MIRMALPLRNSRIRLSQGQIFWREVGQGPVLVFLHGSWSDSSQWISVIERLSEDYACFAVDLLGFGESERPQVHYSIEFEVECLAEFLETLNLRQVYLIGHSLGGWVAASYALKYLDQVQGVMLLSPEGISAENLKQQGGWISWLGGRVPRVFKWLRSLLPVAKYLGQAERLKGAIAYWEKMQQYGTTCQLLFQRRQAEIQAELLAEKLEWLKVPVMILQGGQDTAAAVSQSRAYADLIPEAKLHTISRGGHDLPQELPDEVAVCIREFVG